MNITFKPLLAAITAAFAVASVAAPAAADGVTGTITGVSAGQNVTVNGGIPEFAGLITLTTPDNGQVSTYCIDLFTGTSYGVSYAESAWSAANVSNIATVGSTLSHGYPAVSAESLGAAAGVVATNSQAAAATQAAIWHFSDGAELDASNDPAVVAIYQYLLSAALSSSEPAPSLQITPDVADGFVGTLIGPFQVSTSSDGVQVSVDGATLVAADGSPLGVVADGDEFYVSAADAGTFTVTAVATVTVPSGRVFQTTDTVARQKLIAASSSALSTTATSRVSVAVPAVTTTTAPAPTTTTADTTVTTTADTTVTTVAPTTGDTTVTTVAPTTGDTTAPATDNTQTVVVLDTFGPAVASGAAAPVAAPTPATAAATTGNNSGGGLPVTGADTSNIITLAGATAAVGVLVTAAARRRRSH